MTDEERIAQKIASANRAHTTPERESAHGMDAKYVRVIHESDLARWYAQHASKHADKMPVPKFSPCEERRLTYLVDELHKIQRITPCEDEDAISLQYEIDDVICELYGLDEDEIIFIYRALGLIHQTDEEEDEALARWVERELASEDMEDYVPEEEIMAMPRGADAS